MKKVVITYCKYHMCSKKRKTPTKTDEWKFILCIIYKYNIYAKSSKKTKGTQNVSRVRTIYIDIYVITIYSCLSLKYT